jgi:hypothetical protein
MFTFNGAWKFKEAAENENAIFLETLNHIIDEWCLSR